MRRRLLIVGVVLFAAAVAAAQPQVSREVPDVVPQGFAAYKALGTAAAMKIWLKGSHLEGSETASEEVRVLSRAEALLGRIEGFEVLQMTRLGSRTHLVHVVVHYERGPIFGRFLVYRLRNDWITNAIRFDPAPERVLPRELVGE
jgi:hypothetical protein